MAFSSLSARDIESAIRLNLVPYESSSADSGWDNAANYYTQERVVFQGDIFVITLQKDATYGIASISYRDPWDLSLHDSSGKLLRMDQGLGDPGTDMIVNFIPSYTGDYYIDAAWMQGSGDNAFAMVAVFEDVDTMPVVGPHFGTAGLDTITVKGLRAGHNLSINGETVTLQQVGQAERKYVGVERFRFDDITIATDINGNAGKAYRLYEAAFDRAPDAKGLGFWINGLDHNISLLSVANSFLASPEFKSRYGDDMTQRDYVTALYQNVLNRAPDQAGSDFWVNALNSGSSRAQVLVNFSESIENQQGVIGAIQNGIQYETWVG
ncbi:DUF4214 domain-containing protein [Pigmentiphaga aceris]|uniref:DUF4214 domain-containing protein n=1 Tax=Pigmentiphaga aceris TaxID=1940612 RepID=A0A5C0ATH4_9BURK|nr:DUF4214 domain-containing protein [Pigmentiphaga aceris]QEI04914.1 DUF4214 domain-containing protein [Pigmentiphaga aceris]